MRCAVVAVLLGSYLVAPVVAQTVVRIYGTVSDGTFLPVLVDSTGRLLVTISGTITPTEINLPASTCADPALSETGALTTGIAFTATPSLLDCVNGTAATTLTGSAFTLGSGVALSFPTVSFSNGTNNRLDLASGDSLNLVSGSISLSSPTERGLVQAAGGALGFLFDSAVNNDRPIVRDSALIKLQTYNGATYQDTVSVTGLTSTTLSLLLGASVFLEGSEMTAPAAPAANGYRIFAQDNGAGKTQLMVIFSSGAAQQIAIQP